MFASSDHTLRLDSELRQYHFSFKQKVFFYFFFINQREKKTSFFFNEDFCVVYGAGIIRSLRSQNIPRKVYSSGGFSIVNVITDSVFMLLLK